MVLGAHADEIVAALGALPSMRTVLNNEWEKGLASSLGAGLRALSALEDLDGAIVTLADQPLVDAAFLKSLLAAFDENHRIVASGYDDSIGVPAVFGREYWPDLLLLEGDTGAGAWLRKRRPEVVCISLGDAALDIDTPREAAQLRVMPTMGDRPE